MAIELNMRKGMSAEDARREALRSFGGVEQTKEIYPRTREDYLCWRPPCKTSASASGCSGASPGFSILAILCLTLGIGANAAVFSWVDRHLIPSVPGGYPPGTAIRSYGNGAWRARAYLWPDILDLQRSCRLIDSFIVTKIMGTSLSIGDRAEVTTGSIVSRELFRRHRRPSDSWTLDSNRAKTRGGTRIR